MERAIEIEGEDTSHGQLALKITSERQAAPESALDLMEETSVPDLQRTFTRISVYMIPSGKLIESQIRVKGQEFEINQPPTMPRLV